MYIGLRDSMAAGLYEGNIPASAFLMTWLHGYRNVTGIF
jgi:hypothetical protein